VGSLLQARPPGAPGASTRKLARWINMGAGASRLPLTRAGTRRL